MGLPAVRRDAAPATRPRLRLVPPAKRAPRRNSKAASAQAARRNFTMFAIVVVVVSLLGIGRVWLSVEAAQASADASRLRDSIRAERYKGDMLEVRQSALGSPARIRKIAGKAMDMAPADNVSYLDLSTLGAKKNSGSQKATGSARVSEASVAGALDGVISKMMNLAAGEAEVLLVGDVALASGR